MDSYAYQAHFKCRTKAQCDNLDSKLMYSIYLLISYEVENFFRTSKFYLMTVGRPTFFPQHGLCSYVYDGGGFQS